LLSCYFSAKEFGVKIMLCEVPLLG
jgi:hypothetical protein